MLVYALQCMATNSIHCIRLNYNDLRVSINSGYIQWYTHGVTVFGMRIKQLVGFPAFVVWFLIVFSAYLVNNCCYGWFMHSCFLACEMKQTLDSLLVIPVRYLYVK